VLVPEIAAGAAAELDDLRAACDTVVNRLWAARPDGILIIGTGAETAWRRPDEYGTFAPWGVPLETVPGRRGRPDLPLSLTMGAWLLDRGRHAPAPARLSTPDPAASRVGDGNGVADGAIEVGLASVAAGESPAACAAFGRDQCAPWRRRVALLVMGDGSASRGPTAPGYADARAEPFDASVTAALAAADVDGLLALDPTLAAELMVAGRPGWQVLAGAAHGTGWRGEVLYDAAPYGVNYTVAAWEPA
jgi:hypothetical protein